VVSAEVWLGTAQKGISGRVESGSHHEGVKETLIVAERAIPTR